MNIRSILIAASILACTAVHAKDVHITMYGDSTVYGTQMQPDGTYSRTRNNEPDLVQWGLQKHYGVKVFVENKGVPGSICSDFLWGQRGVSQSWATEMKSSQADIVIMSTGINDAGRMSTNDFIFCYEQLAGIAQQNGKIFIMESSNPVNQSWNNLVWAESNRQNYVATYYDSMLIDQWSMIYNSGINWAAMEQDGIHPTDALYQIKATNTISALIPVIDAIK